jgi:hypothetical protein
MDVQVSPHHSGAFISLDRDQRDALWYALRLELSALADVPLVLGVADASVPADIQRRREVIAWLLDDLGWRRDDARESFTITLPRQELEAWLRRQRDSAADLVAEAREGLRHPEDYRLSPRESLEQARQGLQDEIDHELGLMRACDALLATPA